MFCVHDLSSFFFFFCDSVGTRATVSNYRYPPSPTRLSASDGWYGSIKENPSRSGSFCTCRAPGRLRQTVPFCVSFYVRRVEQVFHLIADNGTGIPHRERIKKRLLVFVVFRKTIYSAFNSCIIYVVQACECVVTQHEYRMDLDRRLSSLALFFLSSPCILFIVRSL